MLSIGSPAVGLDGFNGGLKSPLASWCNKPISELSKAGGSTMAANPGGNRVDQCMIYSDCYVPESVTTDKAKKYRDKNIDLALRTGSLPSIT
jgi:hypothetical protein